jgi:hypothetical protein
LGVFAGAIGAVPHVHTNALACTMLQKRLLPDRLVRQRMGNISPSTLYRWDRNPRLGFPKPVVINGRKYRDEQQLEHFLRSHTAANGDPA